MRGYCFCCGTFSNLLNLSAKQRSLPPVGVGVTVNAYILYDDTFKSQSWLNNEETEADNVPSMDDFKKLFSQVQQYFNNELIMVKFSIESTQKNNDLRVPYSGGKSLDATKTLDRLSAYAVTQSPSNDSIFYYFTESDLLQESKRGDHLELEFTEKATHDTFCSGKVSAAVVKCFPGGKDCHMHAVRATADVYCNSDM
ncbi:uncharacterized protein [Dermacentor andersoni]|uniref:uncharacterized protein isoform X2 n=1 Tax=Dermacentor andersoni TaxID=34620 RepID=UPI002417ADD3|nr:uncharacterized protein LOC129380725 isoform X2 [Dermacentor andersoni]